MTPTLGLHGPYVLVDSLDIGDSRRGASMALAFSSTPLAPTELEDATTRPSRPLLGPEQLARPRRRLHLATSNSLGHATSSPGHEHATRSATATRSLGPSNKPGLELNHSRSTSLDLEQLAQSPIQPSAANSLRHRNDTASSVVSFLQLRTPHPLAHRLSSQDLHRSPQARSLGQHALDKPAARVASE